MYLFYLFLKQSIPINNSHHLIQCESRLLDLFREARRGHPPSPHVIRYPKAAAPLVTFSALTAGLNRSGGTPVSAHGIATEIAQFPLGDLAFNEGPTQCTYSLILVKALRDMCR